MLSRVDDEVRTCSNYNHDKEYDSDVDIDISEAVTSHKPAQTETNIENLSSGELFELCSALDSLATESVDSDKENRALTLEYHSPPTAAEIKQALGEDTVVQEITNMWYRFTSGTDILQCHSSNKPIKEIYRTYQEYMTGLIYPATMPMLCVPTLCPFMTLPNEGEEALD